MLNAAMTHALNDHFARAHEVAFEDLACHRYACQACMHISLVSSFRFPVSGFWFLVLVTTGTCQTRSRNPETGNQNLETVSRPDIPRVQTSRDGGIGGSANYASGVAKDRDVVTIYSKTQQEIVERNFTGWF